MDKSDTRRGGLDPLTLHKKVSASEAVSLTGLSLRSLRAAQAAGQLPHYRFGRAVRFRVSDLLDFCERHRQEAVRG